VKRWHHHPSAPDLVWPSIQPKQRAVSRACAWVIEGRSFSFLANSNHRPRDPAWCFSSQSCQAAAVANRFFTSTLVSVMGCRVASMFPPILRCSAGGWHRSSLCGTGSEFGPNRSVMLPIENVVNALQRSIRSRAHTWSGATVYEASCYCWVIFADGCSAGCLGSGGESCNVNSRSRSRRPPAMPRPLDSLSR
jgi:hypothetical protein